LKRGDSVTHLPLHSTSLRIRIGVHRSVRSHFHPYGCQGLLDYIPTLQVRSCPWVHFQYVRNTSSTIDIIITLLELLTLQPCTLNVHSHRSVFGQTAAKFRVTASLRKLRKDIALPILQTDDPPVSCTFRRTITVRPRSGKFPASYYAITFRSNRSLLYLISCCVIKLGDVCC